MAQPGPRSRALREAIGVGKKPATSPTPSKPKAAKKPKAKRPKLPRAEAARAKLKRFSSGRYGGGGPLNPHGGKGHANDLNRKWGGGGKAPPGLW